jgi:hypothetical protein
VDAQTEVDIYAQDEITAYVGEVKYQNDIDAKKICIELKEKLPLILPAKEKNVEFVLFAKSFSHKCRTVENHIVHCVGIRDIQRVSSKR